MRDYIGSTIRSQIGASTLQVAKDADSALHRGAIKELETAIKQFLTESDPKEIQEKKSRIGHESLAGVLTSMRQLRSSCEPEVPLQNIADLRSALLRVALIR